MRPSFSPTSARLCLQTRLPRGQQQKCSSSLGSVCSELENPSLNTSSRGGRIFIKMGLLESLNSCSSPSSAFPVTNVAADKKDPSRRNAAFTRRRPSASSSLPQQPLSDDNTVCFLPDFCPMPALRSYRVAVEVSGNCRSGENLGYFTRWSLLRWGEESLLQQKLKSQTPKR